MIKLRASAQVNAIFQKTIQVMEARVEWNGTFLVHSNNIILPGKLKSLIFSLDSRKIAGTVVDINTDDRRIEYVIKDPTLENAFNMLLYIFGKWGQIKGLTVEKDYAQLQQMICGVIREVDATAVLNKDHCRFYRNTDQITYEAVISDLMKLLDPVQMKQMEAEEAREEQAELEDSQTKETKDAAQPDVERDVDSGDAVENGASASHSNGQDQEDRVDPKRNWFTEKYHIGLWHKIVWKSERIPIAKEQLPKSVKKNRIGKEFYLSNYLCPDCGSFLHMVTYPVYKEFMIDTDEGEVMLARAFTCNKCNRFFTPRPGKMIREGDLYVMDFERDHIAYEDYLKLLGEDGAAVSNCNYNEYVKDIMKAEQQLHESGQHTGSNAQNRAAGAIDQKDLSLITSVLKNPFRVADKPLLALKEKIDSRFFPVKISEPLDKQVTAELIRRKLIKTDKPKQVKADGAVQLTEAGGASKGKADQQSTNANGEQGVSVEDNTASAKSNHEKKGAGSTNADKTERNHKSQNQESKNRKKPPRERKVTAIWNSHANQQSEGGNREMEADATETRTGKFRKIRTQYTEEDDPQRNEVVTDGEGRTKARVWTGMEIQQNLSKRDHHSVKNGNHEYDSKYDSKYDSEYDSEEQSDEDSELTNEGLIRRVRLAGQLDYQQLQKLFQQVNQQNMPDDVKEDLLDQLTTRMEEKADEELAANERQMTRQTHNRGSLLARLKDLKDRGYPEKIRKPYEDKIRDRIMGMDQEEIAEICPNPDRVDYEQGLEAMERIKAGDFLPELKDDVLGRIDRRLRLMKSDEANQLTDKFQHDIDWTEESYPAIVIYNQNRMENEQSEEADVIRFQNAIDQIAGSLNRYEYPVFLCDTTHNQTGKSGFVLTPDNIYYSLKLSRGVLKVSEIKNLYIGEGLLSKGLFAEYEGVGDVKISNLLKAQQVPDQEQFLAHLNEFIGYLKEKPDSRDLKYMAKEEHQVKCCYRCGFKFSSGSICPHCGSYNE